MASPGRQELRGALPQAHRRLAVAMAAIATALLPWAVYLSATLPSRHLSDHYTVAWVGFDVALAAAVAATAAALVRAPAAVPVAASIAGTLLVCDAWFDVLSAHGAGEVLEAAIEAALAELPLAALCFWLARDSERTLVRALGETFGREPEAPDAQQGPPQRVSET